MTDTPMTFDRAMSLYRAGSMEKALETIERLLDSELGDVALLNLAGACCYGMDRKAEAVAWWTRAVRKHPAYAEAFSNLGTVLGELGRDQEGEAALRQALAIDPDHPEANNNLGNLLRETGRLTEAEAAYRRALAKRPEYGDAQRNLAGVLRVLGRLNESEAAYRQALNVQPQSSATHNGLGLLLHAMGRLAEAEEAFRQALSFAPDFAEAHANLARLLYEVTRFEEAGVAARRATELNPRLADAQLVLGGTLAAQNAGDVSEIINAYRRAVEFNPDSLPAHSNLAYTLLFDRDEGYEVLEECRRLASHFEAPFLARAVRYANDRVPGKRLRVGYVSPDFRAHCQSFFMTPLLKNHDPAAVEIYGYSSARGPDDVTRQLASYANVWRDVADLNDDDLAKTITDDRIDILVDLTMHMTGGRPLLFARRPAPVQVAWLAYPGTTGSSAIGYRLTDPWLDPIDNEKADDRYSERSIRLPDTFWCYDPLATEPVVSALPAARNGSITFGCLNSPRKLTDRTFRMWAKVLTEVAGSNMILLVANGVAREHVSAKLESLGVERSRLTFVDYQPRDEYLATYQKIDIALDTFPYNGHTTSLDGFWMGVPVVTAIGNNPVSRAGYALLGNLGLEELAARSDEQFVDVAARLARDLPRLSALRSGLRARMQQSPLMDGARFARAMEAAYRQMWHAWCEPKSR